MSSEREQIDDILNKFEVLILELVGEKFAPKQDAGSPERKRLLSIIPQILPIKTDIAAMLNAQLQAAKAEAQKPTRDKNGLIPFDELQQALSVFDKIEVTHDPDGDPRRRKIEGIGMPVLRVVDVQPTHRVDGKNILHIHTTTWSLTTPKEDKETE